MDEPSPARDLEAEAELARALDEVLEPWKDPGRRCTLLFSGGVDSGLLAWELRGQPGLFALTVGRTGSADLVAAKAAAEEIGLRWAGVTIADVDLARLERQLAEELAGASPAHRAIFLAFAAAVENAPDTKVLCGQGADELFLGYAHFRDLPPAEAARRARDDLRRLNDADWPRSVRLARALGRDVVAPYLDPRFVRAALKVPLEARLPRGEPKGWFRRWARARGLPESVAGRPKRALQYGTRIHQWLARTSS